MAARAYSTGRAALRSPEPGDIARPFPPIPSLRAWLEARCEQLSDELQRLIGLLDTLDGDCDLETSLGGLVVRLRNGQVVDDAEQDPAELGIADRDALDDPELYFGSFAFDGSGHKAARALLRKVGAS